MGGHVREWMKNGCPVKGEEEILLMLSPPLAEGIKGGETTIVAE